MNLSVGDVIYLIDGTTRAVIPAQVNEQIVTRKLDGESITHKVELPNGKAVVLERLDVIFYTSLEDVRSHLMKKAEQLINEGVEKASAVAVEKFNSQSVLSSPTESVTPEVLTQEDNQSSKMQMTLPDGQVANVSVKIPEEFLNENLGN